MGYSALYFGHRVHEWLRDGWLRPGDHLLDFGAQEFYTLDAKTRHEVTAFLQKQHVAQENIDALVQNDDLSVRAIFKAFAVQYSSVDVDGAHGSAFLDLNSSEPPAYWRNVFDFINNEGTIEHLANPLNGFQLAHEMVRVGGVVRHSFPLIGWREHGFFYGTTKFYAELIGANGYELLQARAMIGEPSPFDDRLFAELWDETKDRPADAPPMIANLWGNLAYRKTANQPFVIPVDHVGGPAAEAMRARVIENYRKLAQVRPYPFTLVP
jgi:hypothetical protein